MLHVEFGRAMSKTVNPPEKLVPSRPAFQGHSRSLEPTLLFPTVTVGLTRTVSEINGDFGRKSQNFPSPRN